jgi:hypothetical protein
MALQIKLDPVFPSNPNFLAKKGDVLLHSLENLIQGDIARQLESAMEKRVANWKHKPTIKSNFQSLPTRLSLLVVPAGAGLKQWKIISKGARPHLIFPKSIQKGQLFIHGGRGGYASKTAPGNVYGRSSSYKNNFYWATVVHHPGVQARDFEQHVAEEETAEIINKIQKAIDRAVKA